MGKLSRTKGANEERAVVNAHRERGIYAKRTPQSGGNADYGSHDVDIHWKGEDEAPLIAEVKVGKQVPKFVYDALGENDVLVMRRDRCERVFAVPERVWMQLMERS